MENKWKTTCVIVIALVLINISFVSALLEVSKPMDIVKGQPLTFDKKEVAYNPLWEKYAPQVNNLVIK